MLLRTRLAAVLSPLALACACQGVWAGPPFQTDDPVPVDLHASEFYVFSTYAKSAGDRQIALPAFEYNYGVLPDTQLHLVVPIVSDTPDGGTRHRGLGDLEVGIKYRLLHETATLPQVGIFPMVELPTGSARRGLGNGRAWWRLPVWLQKSWGDWTSYGGAGIAVNRAPGQKNYAFGGWLLQNDLSRKLTLGAEVFAQGRDTVDGESTTEANVGGLYKFSPQFNVLFSAGRSIAGERHRIAYLGLWWGWGGPPPSDRKLDLHPAASGD